MKIQKDTLRTHKNNSMNHNIPYATQNPELSAAYKVFNTLFESSHFFFGKRLTLREFSAEAGIPLKTVWRILHNPPATLNNANKDAIHKLIYRKNVSCLYRQETRELRRKSIVEKVKFLTHSIFGGKGREKK